jgi:SAM-dependent methyltransferase
MNYTSRTKLRPGLIFKHIKTILPILLACICIVSLCRNPAGAAGQTLTGQSGGEPDLKRIFKINITNDTDRQLKFHARILHSEDEPDVYYLSPGEIQTLLGRKVLEFQILPKELSRIYFLAPGEDYSVRLIDGKDLKVFQKVNGYKEAVMLAPFVPSPNVVIERMLSLAGVTGDSIVYDLGCGDGRVVIAAAKIYGARGVGIDIDPDLIDKAREKALEAGVEDLVDFRVGDIFETSLTEATMVYVFLFPDSNRLLRPYLEKQLRKGTTVAALGFNFPAWEDRLKGWHDILDDDGYHRIVYIYER